MTDKLLLEAMREVDALTPSAPPIAPGALPGPTLEERFDQLAKRADLAQARRANARERRELIARILLGEPCLYYEAGDEYIGLSGKRLSADRVRLEETRWP